MQMRTKLWNGNFTNRTDGFALIIAWDGLCKEQ
jgi:hypothetical protein